MLYLTVLLLMLFLGDTFRSAEKLIDTVFRYTDQPPRDFPLPAPPSPSHAPPPRPTRLPTSAPRKSSPSQRIPPQIPLTKHREEQPASEDGIGKLLLVFLYIGIYRNYIIDRLDHFLI